MCIQQLAIVPTNKTCLQGEIENYPAPYENTTFWSKVESVTQPDATAKDIAIGFWSSGYYCGNFNDVYFTFLF